ADVYGLADAERGRGAEGRAVLLGDDGVGGRARRVGAEVGLPAVDVDAREPERRPRRAGESLLLSFARDPELHLRTSRSISCASTRRGTGLAMKAAAAPSAR